ncbi:MAG TPA: twin-arginine translocase TatA/TatE family subunit [Candidatus Binataceae bacterium]
MNLFEIIVILAVALMVLGPERLPEVLQMVGKVLRELRSASNTVLRELTEAIEEQPARTTRPVPAPPETTKPAASAADASLIEPPTDKT